MAGKSDDGLNWRWITLRHIVVLICGIVLLFITIEIVSFWVTCEHTATGEMACGVFKVICAQVAR